MKKTIFLLLSLIIGTLLFAEEPSAFEAGNLDSPNPYGLTQSEKKIVEQNKNIQSISRNLFDTNQTQSELRNELDGIKSLLGSINEKQLAFSDKLESDKNGSLKDTISRVDTLTKRLDENFKLQNDNYDKIMATLSEMAKMIDEMSQNYVSKEQLQLNLGKKYKDFKNKSIAKPNVTAEKNKTAKEPTEAQMDAEADLSEKNDTQAHADIKKQPTDDELFKQGEALYAKNQMTEAENIFKKLVEKKYKKPATLHFRLGEISYKNGEYKEALGHFQDSINADEKSSFIPLMLFHSAASLEKIGNKNDAKKVLETLIKTYPKNYLVPSAKKKLSEL
jgi:TolA-binding protein